MDKWIVVDPNKGIEGEHKLFDSEAEAKAWAEKELFETYTLVRLEPMDN